MNAESVGNYSPISIDQSCFRGLWLYPDISPYGEQKKQDALSKTHLGTHWRFCPFNSIKKRYLYRYADIRLWIFAYIHPA